MYELTQNAPPRAGAVPLPTILTAFKRLDDYLKVNEYRGYEFDDYLGSPVVKMLCLNTLFLQRVAVQVGKLNPVNIRPLLRIRKLESTKARGFMAKGHLAMYQATGNSQHLRQAEEHLSWLLSNRANGYRGISWGNAFDFASRGGFFPKGKPTIVWTAHIAETFALAHEITGAERYVRVLKDASEFILSELERHQDEHGHCFAYAPGILNLVHNSNLLGAATLLRCWQYFPDDGYREAAGKAYAWTMSHQCSDGAWYYGAESKYRWIDNFHTAYNIDCLLTGRAIAGESMVPWSVVERSYRYWVSHFFDQDGGPWYFHDKAYPYDIQSASQAIETLCRCAPYFSDAYALAHRVLHWTLTKMQMPNGAFRFQLRPFWSNNQESLHWGQATMLAALGLAYKLSADNHSTANGK